MSREKTSASDDIADGLALLTDTAFEIAGFIPGVGKVLEGARIFTSMRDRVYLNKVARFLREFDSISAERRNAFFSSFRSHEDLERFGETVLLLLERADEIDKPSVIGRLHRAAAFDELTLETAQRLSAIVNRAYMADLHCLQHFEDELSGFQNEVTSALHALGLLSIKSVDLNRDDDPNGYQLSGFGRQLLDYGLREHV